MLIHGQAEVQVLENRIEELEARRKSLGTSFFTIDVLWKMVRWMSVTLTCKHRNSLLIPASSDARRPQAHGVVSSVSQ
jgi:hypothetical protein